MPEPAPPAAVPAEPGYFERAVEHILPRPAAAVLEDAARIAPELAAAVKDHAGSVFDVAGDVLAVLKLVDPADAAAVGAVEVLVPKVLGLVESAASIARQVHHG